MRILTVVRQVLDAEESVSIQDGSVALDGRKLVLDTMDEYGVEEALRLREGAAAGAEVIALAIGPARSEDALRSALAMGADRAILVETAGPLDVIARKQRGRPGGSQRADRLDLLGRSASGLG